VKLVESECEKLSNLLDRELMKRGIAKNEFLEQFDKYRSVTPELE
jgi:hypothetical protein